MGWEAHEAGGGARGVGGGGVNAGRREVRAGRTGVKVRRLTGVRVAVVQLYRSPCALSILSQDRTVRHVPTTREKMCLPQREHGANPE
jgi:hypothetical protein